MFWDRFYQLCIKQNTKPNPVAKDLGISSGVLTKWKSGGIPNGETLTKIADYFDVSVDYLLERTDESDLSTKKTGCRNRRQPVQRRNEDDYYTSLPCNERKRSV